MKVRNKNGMVYLESATRRYLQLYYIEKLIGALNSIVELLPDKLAMAIPSFSLNLLNFLGNWRNGWGKSSIWIQDGLYCQFSNLVKNQVTNSGVEWKKNISTATTPV